MTIVVFTKMELENMLSWSQKLGMADVSQNLQQFLDEGWFEISARSLIKITAKISRLPDLENKDFLPFLQFLNGKIDPLRPVLEQKTQYMQSDPESFVLC